MTEQNAIQKTTSSEKQLLQDIRQFAKVWVNNYQNKQLDSYALMDENFEMDCRSFGFAIEPGWEWMQQPENQSAAYDKSAMEKVIDTITDWKLLGSVIYARWKEQTITLEGVRMLGSYEVRQWFVMTLCRLARITGEQELLRPYIVCHVHGKKDTAPSTRDALDRYYQIQRGSWGDAFTCDRPSTEWNLQTESEDLHQQDYISKNPFVMPEYNAVSFRADSAGQAVPEQRSEAESSDGIAVVCEDTPDALLETYRGRKVSYLFAGTHEVDLAMALRKLRERMGIRKLLLDCDWDLQRRFLEEGLVDELSLVVDAEKENGKPTLPVGFARQFQLLEQRPLEAGAVLMRYGNRKINKGNSRNIVEHNKVSVV